MREAQVQLEVVGGGMGPNLPHELNSAGYRDGNHLGARRRIVTISRMINRQHRDAEDRVNNSLPFD
jgi:hypothetical protein